MADDVFERLTKCVVDVLQVDPGAVTPEADLADDLGSTSLVLVELVMAIEEEFGVDVPDAHVEEVRTVDDLRRLVIGRSS